MFQRATGLGSGDLGLDPSQIIKLTLLIWTNYFIHWLIRLTIFFQVPAIHEKLLQAVWGSTGNDKAISPVAHNREREQESRPM